MSTALPIPSAPAHITEPTKRRHRRAAAAPAMPEQDLPPGFEWLLQFAALRKVRGYLSVQQVAAILGCAKSAVHEMVESTLLDCHAVRGHPDSAGHYKIYPASVLRYLWENSNHYGKGTVPVKAAFLMCYELMHHLPAHALKLLIDLGEARRESQSEAIKALRLKPADSSAELLIEARQAGLQSTSRKAAPPPAASRLF